MFQENFFHPITKLFLKHTQQKKFEVKHISTVVKNSEASYSGLPEANQKRHGGRYFYETILLNEIYI